jgi:hypothetical protein
MRTLFQIRQVAHLMEHDMQPARMKPHAKEHTNNPVQRPHLCAYVQFIQSPPSSETSELTLGGMQVPWLELESTNPGSPGERGWFDRNYYYLIPIGSLGAGA